MVFFRCSSEDGCDTLIMSTSQNYTEHRHEFSGQSSWIDFEIPGLKIAVVFFFFLKNQSTQCQAFIFTAYGFCLQNYCRFYWFQNSKR